MAKRGGKDQGRPFIDRADRPTVVDYEQQVANLTLRELTELVDDRVDQRVARRLPAIGWPEWRKPEWRKPEHVKPEQLKPEHVKPEQLKPEHVKPEQLKPEHVKPEHLKPEQLKPEMYKPEMYKPERKPYDGFDADPDGAPAVGGMRELVRGVEAELVEAIELLAAERTRRTSERSSVPVVTYDSDSDESLRLLLPGTATLFVAPSGDRLLEDVAQVFTDADEEAVVGLINRLEAEAAHRSRVSPLAAAQELAAGKAFATIRFGDQVLAENLGLPNGIGFGAISFPYAGGELDPKRFVLEQFVRGALQERLDGVLVVRPARLSDAERAALELIPPRQREVGIAQPGHVAITVTTVTIALFVVAVHTPTLTGGNRISDIRSQLDRVSLAADKIARLKTPLAVGELVALRQELQAQLF